MLATQHKPKRSRKQPELDRCLQLRRTLATQHKPKRSRKQPELDRCLQLRRTLATQHKPMRSLKPPELDCLPALLPTTTQQMVSKRGRSAGRTPPQRRSLARWCLQLRRTLATQHKPMRSLKQPELD